MPRKKKAQPYLENSDEIRFTMTFKEEHEDGSATYNLDLNPFTNSKLVEIGVIALLKQHIEQEKVKKLSFWAKIKRFLHK
jgi:hypothetical protein